MPAEVKVANLRLKSSSFPDGLVPSLVAREAALWVGRGFDESPAATERLAALIGLTWRLVLCDSPSAELATCLEAAPVAGDALVRRRGFIYVVAIPPGELELPRRALPVYFLAGRTDESTAGGVGVSPRQAALRRLEMIDRLVKAKPRVLVVLASADGASLDEALALWGEDGFRPRLLVVDPDGRFGDRLDSWLTATPGVGAIDHYVAPVGPLVDGCRVRLSTELPEGRLYLRIRDASGSPVDIDVTECEQVESPLLDRFDLIQSQHLNLIQPGELTDAQFNAFFDRTSNAWAAYAAGVPWDRAPDARRQVLSALKEVANRGPEWNCLQLILAESGAGGTTLARAISFAAARDGYPTLVARDLAFRPNPTEVRSFLNRVVDRLRADSVGAYYEGPGEPPWLIVFDVGHWYGRETDLIPFLSELTRSGRPAVVLTVVHDAPDNIRQKRNRIVESLHHELEQEEAVALGRHLDKFLEPRKRALSPDQWREFWHQHSPAAAVSEGLASFWIALEFWLRRQINLGESIQDWLRRQVRKAELPDELFKAVLEIAAMSVEHQPLPEGLLDAGTTRPADALDDVRASVPALALHSVIGDDREWFLAHDLLGRYVINLVFYDRPLLDRLGLGAARDPVHLRLLLLERIACRPAMARRIYRPLATLFAETVLKLDVSRLEYAPYWEELLATLDRMPIDLWQGSRTFNHHAAVTRRRVATMPDYFRTTLVQQRDLLERAVRDIENALAIDATTDEDSDLNLFNSLSLAYQNLANVEREVGTEEARIHALWQKADDAAREAKKLNPQNSFVLETLARNLTLTARLYPERSAECAAEALGYVFQALATERGVLRRGALNRIANDAIELLRGDGARQQINRLMAQQNPFGILAYAWLELAGGAEGRAGHDLTAVTPDRAARALDVLRTADGGNALVLRMRYDLTAIAAPNAFREQLELLDGLEGAGSRVALQLRMERAILLHQCHRHREANQAFQAVRKQFQSPANEEFVEVPDRLSWLLDDHGKRRICTAVVVEGHGYRGRARVAELDRTEVPFFPQEFGAKALSINQTRRCSINFGPKGPFMKPPPSEG